MLARLGRWIDARVVGGVLAALGLALLAPGDPLTSALALESLAAAFWIWSRASADGWAQVARWSWLRRPATALWIAYAAHAAAPGWSHDALIPARGLVPLLMVVEAVAVVWAGLELLAALPLARHFSDLPGPLLGARPWLPVILPSAGFLLLWRQSMHWNGVPEVRQAAVLLLLVTALLGALRAFARRQWTASLRWLAVTDCALAAILVAEKTVPSDASFLLWFACCGGHAFLLAGELHGAAPRRGPFMTRLWRAASWTALACLSWPALLAVTEAAHPGFRPLLTGVAAVAVALAAWITVGRMTTAPERRMIVRANPIMTFGQIGAWLVLVAGPTALMFAWWAGFEPPAHVSLAMLLPALAGGAGAVLSRQGHGRPFFGALRRAGGAMPPIAGALFRAVVRLEQWVVRQLGRVTRGVTGAINDLHTGDPQEYLLFLVGLAVLVVMLPLLQ